MKFKDLTFILILIVSVGNAQNADMKLYSKGINAEWIIPVRGLYQPICKGVFLFRKEFDIKEKSNSFVIHISADSHYRLYVNGVYIGNGPALGDIANWQYDTYDIAKNIIIGNNVIAVEIWNYNDTPWAQITLRTALFIQGNSEKEEVVNTNNSWFFKPDVARTFLPHDEKSFPYMMGVGNGELFDAEKYDYNWKLPNYSNIGFLPAVALEKGMTKEQNKHQYYWSLIARPIPFMEEKNQKLSKIISVQNIKIDDNFLVGKSKITIPPNTECSIIFDQGRETTAYPVLQVSGGKKSKIKLIYAESFFDEKLNKYPVMTDKYNKIFGYSDIFLPSGNEKCEFSTLRFRTFRYIQLNISTSMESLTINEFSSIFTAYPFSKKGDFVCNDTVLNKIFEYGWNTARLCAHENYFDCPYYEQQQYFGDLNNSTPITASISGDAKLMKNAIFYGNSSRLNGDLTMCAYPSYENKIIPTFSLSWIDIINKYLLYTGDTVFVKQMFPGVNDVLNWFEKKLNNEGMLGVVPYWNFIDCTSEWRWDESIGDLCVAPCASTGNSAILTLQFIWGLQNASEIYLNCGVKAKSDSCIALAEKIKSATYKACWDKNKKLLFDCPTQKTFSQHTNILGILTGTIPESEWQDVLDKILTDKTLIQTSSQFHVYLHQAFQKCKRTGLFINHLDVWKKLIDDGFTTFPEYPYANTRSYIHAWNAYPTYEFLTIICGIKVMKPGFTEIEISPDLTGLQFAKGSLPTPFGLIETDYKILNDKLFVQITIPNGIIANFIYKNKTYELKQRNNIFNVDL
jgi:alpha-L-rhamnosidase